MNLNVVLQMMGQDRNASLSLLFSGIQKDPKELNCPSKIPLQAPVPDGSFNTLKSPAILPLEDSALQPLVRRISSGKVHEQDPWILSETQEAKKLSA